MLLSIGNRQGFAQTGFQYQDWARESYTILNDIDENELKKPNLHVSLPVVGDAGELIRGLLAEAKKRGADKEYPLFKGEDWRKQCLLWKKKYPVVTEKHYETLEEGCTNIYAFYGELSKAMKENETLMVSVGTSRVAGSQAFQVKKGQRFITNPNTASMGFCLPAATGIAVAQPGKAVVCVTAERFWAVIPVLNGIIFLTSPIYSLHEEGEKGLSIRELCSMKIFWVVMLMMTCAGASEQAVSQWASTFAEEGLKVSKTVGDLAGPMAFAVLMGLARLLYGKYGEKIDLKRFMIYSSILCVISYLCIAFVPVPMLSLIGCAVCGFSVGIMWPGTFSIASASIRGGGTAMFALLALAGDLGCSGGPTLAGFVSSSVGNNLRMGILAAIVFPVLLLIGIQICKKSQKN